MIFPGVLGIETWFGCGSIFILDLQMAKLTYGEWQLVFFAVVAVVGAIGAASAGEGAVTVLSLLAVAGVIIVLAWRRAKE